MDLAGAIKSAFPMSIVSLCQLGVEGKSLIAAAPSTVCVLLRNELASGDMLDVLGRCVEGGGRVVFIGAVEGVSFAAKMVDMPFTSEMVLSALPRQCA
jgi:hypothetical protein